MRGIIALARGMVLELVRKKDFYVLFILMFVLMGLLASQTFFQMEGISRYIKDLGYTLLMFFSFIIAVTFGAKQMPAEIASRTIYPLLAKPISRYMIITGKFVGTVLVSSAAFTIFYLVYAGFCIADTGGADIVLLVQAYISGILFLVMVSGLIIFLSTFFTVSASLSLMFLFYIASSGIAQGLRDSAFFADRVTSALSGILFYIIPHLEFFDMRVRFTHSWDPLSWGVMGGLTLYTALYVTFLIVLSGVIFSRKKL